MDLALTQSIIKANNNQHLHQPHHQEFSRANSQQIISTTYKQHPPPHQTHSLAQIETSFHLRLSTEEQQQEQQQQQQQLSQQQLDVQQHKSELSNKFDDNLQLVNSAQKIANNNKKYYFGMSKTMVNLYKRNDGNKIDEENEAYELDPKNYKESCKKLVQNINDHLNLTLNSITLDHKKPNQVIVYVCLVFLKIGEIDTVKERFQAEAYIESYWDDETIDPAILQFDPRANWNPELHIENAIGELKQEIRYKIEKHNNKCRVYEIRNIKGVFWERLELWDFPLDIQELSITLSTSRSDKEIAFEENPHHPSAVNTQDFLNQQEWNIFTHVNTSKKVITDLWNNCKRPCFSTTSFVSRKPGYFIYNAYMLIFFVSTLGFVPFSFAISNNHFRIQVTSLLILTSVNFRWIVTQRLPTVSYLTTLDKYAIGALIFLVALCGWHATIGSSVIYDNDMSNKERVDSIVLIIIGILYVIYHIVYFTLFYLKYRKYDTIGKQAQHDDFQGNNIVTTYNNSNNNSNNSINKNMTNNFSSNSILVSQVSRVIKRKNSSKNMLTQDSEAKSTNLIIDSNLKTIRESISTIEVGNSHNNGNVNTSTNSEETAATVK